MGELKEESSGSREAGLPFFEDLRDVPVSLRRVLKKAAVVAVVLTGLAAVGLVGFACWLTGILSVAALCVGCWMDAARKLAYCRRWWKKGKPYDEWSF